MAKDAMRMVFMDQIEDGKILDILEVEILIEKMVSSARISNGSSRKQFGDQEWG